MLLLAIGLFIAPSFSPGESNTSYQAPSGHRTRKVLEYKDEQQQQQQQHTYLSHAYLSQTFFSLLKAYAFNNQTENKSVTAEEKEVAIVLLIAFDFERLLCYNLYLIVSCHHHRAFVYNYGSAGYPQASQRIIKAVVVFGI